MKIKILSLLCCSMLIVGCSNNKSNVNSILSINSNNSDNSSSNITTSNEPSKDVNSRLQDFKVENFDKYSSIGYGVFTNDTNDNTKQLRRIKKSNNTNNKASYLGSSSYYVSSKSPFTLLGLNGNNIEKLNFTDNSNSININIESFRDLGNFIAFMPELDYGNIERTSHTLYFPEQYPYFYGQITMADLFATYSVIHWDTYFLSKKTGKIYNVSTNLTAGERSENNEEENKIMVSEAAYGGDTLYVRLKNSSKICIVKEENNSLVFTETNLPEARYVDKYGNIIYESGIITTDMKNHKFTSYFEDTEYKDYTFDSIEKEIKYYSKDGQHIYVFGSDNKFIETIGSGEVLVSSGYIYDSSNEEYGTKEEYIQKFISSGKELRNIKYCCYIGDEIFYTSGKKLNDLGDEIYFDENYKYIFTGGSIKRYSYNNELNMYVSIDENSAYISNIYSESAPEYPEFERPIFRNNYVYCLQNSTIIKKDIFTGSETIIGTGIYTISYLEVDEFGYIKVIGVDDSFNKFEGYLEEDDSISFEEKEMPKLSTYTLYPIN